MTTNAELWRRAQNALPGGVSSPVRAFGAVGGDPLFVHEAQGAHFVDADGRRFLDFVMSWGPLILGHAHPEIVDALHEATPHGLSYGAPHESELLLAEKVLAWYPGAERVRFTSSGTEATMSALRLARGATGRDRIVKFDGCYHGHSDGLLVAAGSGAKTFGTPSSAGVPGPIAELTSVLPLDDEGRLDEFFAQHGAETAAVIIEPVPANNGLLLQRPVFLERLRALTSEHGVLLIFDEVISGFRVARGGAAELYGIEPDLATFGKIIGGGLPVGAFAGRAELFEHLAPNGPVYQAGTLSGNPAAMTAGLRTLEILERDDAWSRLEELGSRLQEGVHGLQGFVRQGSIFWCDLGAGAADRYRDLFHGCLERGIYLAPSAFEVGFLSTSHTEAHVDELARVLTDVLA
ncbi:MAG: aspartate aminotransferase family protein [Planctomycetes bacterium]|nr:aspartate aminotransferase family protein [Planctomycetota bacterium]MDP6424486.1 glutamate-1-semialdehyde 2,1-aminomutase [Planctomycetota bacterium]